MDIITIQELAKVLADKKKIELNVARTFVSTMFDVIRVAIERDRIVKVKGLGTFKLIEIGARESVNVNNGERVVIRSHGKITFTPDSIMKEIVNKPFSQFETVVLNDGVEFEDMPHVVAEPILDSDHVVDSVTVKQTPDETETVLDCGVEGSSVIERDSRLDVLGGQDVKEVTEVQDCEANLITEDGCYACEEDKDVDCISSDNVVNHGLIPDSDAADNGEIVSPDLSRETVLNSVNDEISNTVSDDNISDEKKRGYFRTILLCVIAIVMLAGAAYGGFLYGLYVASDKTLSKTPSGSSGLPSDIDLPKTITDTVEDLSQQKDTMHVVAQTVNHEVTTLAVKAKRTEKIGEKKDIKQEDKFDSSKYDAMDNRVRTGAYRIVGTDCVVMVKKGETLKSISDRMLGPGMECYVEVYNGLKDGATLEEGGRLKIPKLELKRKRR